MDEMVHDRLLAFMCPLCGLVGPSVVGSTSQVDEGVPSLYVHFRAPFECFGVAFMSLVTMRSHHMCSGLQGSAWMSRCVFACSPLCAVCVAEWGLRLWVYFSGGGGRSAVVCEPRERM